MQVDSPERIRNVAVAGHNDTGKTTLVSALLYTGGVTTRFNRVEDGNTLTDFDPEEIERGISIGLAVCFAPWQQHKVNLIDCPGYGIFFTETKAGLRAADAVLLCVNGVAGVEVNTEKVWSYAEEIGLPVMIHLTKMDRERADFERDPRRAAQALRPAGPAGPAPDRQGAGLRRRRRPGPREGLALHPRRQRQGRAGRDPGRPGRAGRDRCARQLVEAVAETDDTLMEGFFETGNLSQEDLEAGLRQAVARRQIFPLTLSSGAHGIGSSALLDSFVDGPPLAGRGGALSRHQPRRRRRRADRRPAGPLAALVFKTLSDPFTGKISILRVVSGTLPTDVAGLQQPRRGDREARPPDGPPGQAGHARCRT